eukprot:COSAG06_NODE_54294_length_295_cov_0.969388_1_plen_26_part_01
MKGPGNDPIEGVPKTYKHKWVHPLSI